MAEFCCKVPSLQFGNSQTWRMANSEMVAAVGSSREAAHASPSGCWELLTCCSGGGNTGVYREDL